MARATPSSSAAKAGGGKRGPTIATEARATRAKTRFVQKVMFLPATRNDAWLSVRFIRCQHSLFRGCGASIKGGEVCNLNAEWWSDGVVEWCRNGLRSEERRVGKECRS